MSGEIEIHRKASAEVDSWSDVMPDVVKLAQHIADTEFVPKGLRGKAPAVAAAILSGREIGIGPMTAMQHMHVVEGRPTMSAELKRARVLAAGHEIVYEETSTTRCVVKGRRRGSDNWTTVSWTMDDAKRAELTGKANWKRHPRRMLQARATGELCDIAFPDVVGGLPTYEEAIDQDSDYAEIVDQVPDGEPVPATPKRRTAQRKTTARPVARAAESAAEPPPAADPVPLPGEDGFEQLGEAQPAPAAEPLMPVQGPDDITDAQLTKLHTVLGQLDIKDRDDKLRIARKILDQPNLMSSTSLSKDDAGALIDTLEACTGMPDPQGHLMTILEAFDDEGHVVDAELVEETTS